MGGLWSNRDFQLLVGVDVAVVGFMVGFLAFVPPSVLNFNIILSSTTSLGAIVAANALGVKAMRASMLVDSLDLIKVMSQVNRFLKQGEKFFNSPEFLLIFGSGLKEVKGGASNGEGERTGSDDK